MCFVLFLLEFFFIYLLVFGPASSLRDLSSPPRVEPTPLAVRAKTPGSADWTSRDFPIFARIFETLVLLLLGL